MSKTRQLVVMAVVQLDEGRVLRLAKEALARGIDPLVIIEALREGVARVGELYERGEYFLADLIMSAEIFKEVVKLVLDSEPPATVQGPPIIFGTVEEDIHDIGKNIVIGLMRCRGLQVCDLGVDVPAADFVAKIQEMKSNILCISGLITLSYDSMKNTVALLREKGLRESTTVIIGGLVNEAVRQYVGADYWARDCAAGVDLCLGILNWSYGTVPVFHRRTYNQVPTV